MSSSASRQEECVDCGTGPREKRLDPWPDDPFSDYETEPVVAFFAT
jgi:hypothetical protein